MIDKQIDRDIEAQRADLNKKQTILGNYMKMGYDAQDAYKLAAADARDRVATQLEMVASKYGDEKANADMLNTIGALKNKSMQDTIDVNHRQSQLDIQKGQLSIQYQDLALRKQQAGLAMEERERGRQIAGALMKGQKVKNFPLMYLPENLRDKGLYSPDGSLMIATDPEAKKTMNERYVVHGEAMGALNNLDKLQKDIGRGLLTNITTRGSEAIQATTQALFKLSENSGTKISGMSTQDQEWLKKTIPDPTSWNTAKFKSLINLWKKDINDKTNSMEKQYIQLGR